MVLSGRQLWFRAGITVVRSHDSRRQQEVSEQGGHQEILSEEFPEEILGKHQPSDGVGNGSKDPVELSQRRPSVLQITRNLADLFKSNLRTGGIRRGLKFKRILKRKVSESDLDRRGETRSKEVGWQVRVHRQSFVGSASS